MQNTMNAIEITNLKKIYPGGVRALEGISFSVEKGDFFALLGPNGAGKTTTIGIISSLTNKTSGRISVFGHDLDTRRDLAKTYIGLVPQEFNFAIFEKVQDIILQQAGYYGVPREVAQTRAKKLLKKLGLWSKRNVASRTLSGGMKRKLMIVRGLIHEPKLLILDEPTAGVDVETRREMWEFLTELNKKGTTIILTTHYLEEAEQLCRNVAIIDNARIIENTGIKALINKLDREEFILDTIEPIGELGEFRDCQVKKIDDTTLSVLISRKQNLNQVFDQLNRKGIKILSMRNKSSRLEELFVGLMRRNHGS